MDAIGENVHRLGTEWVGWYLLVDDGEVTVVDCGFRGYFGQLPRALDALGLPLDAVAAVVLTHYHPDHVGAAERIRVEAKAEVFAPVGDADAVSSGKAPAPGGFAQAMWRPRMLRYAGHAARNGALKSIPVGEVRAYGDGERLDVPGALRAVHTPGHTGGHCSLLAERNGVLFAGDALATVSFLDGSAGPQLLPFHEDPGQARDSLPRLVDLPAGTVAVGHGEPFDGAPALAVERALSGEPVAG